MRLVPRLAVAALPALAWSALAFGSALVAPACAERADDAARLVSRAAGPPFTLEASRAAGELVVRVVPALDLGRDAPFGRERALRGVLDLEIRGAGGRPVAAGPMVPSVARRVRVDAGSGPWTIVVRWTDPLGVAGATATREIPEPAAAPAPRFAPIAPVVIGGVRIDEAISIP